MRRRRQRDEVAQQVEVVLAKQSTLKVAICAAALPLSFLALWPTANVLAGTATTVDVNIALAASLTLTGVSGVLGTAYRREKKRANDLDTRNRRLVMDVKKAQDALKSAEERVSILESDLSNVRSDAQRLRLQQGPRSADGS